MSDELVNETPEQAIERHIAAINEKLLESDPRMVVGRNLLVLLNVHRTADGGASVPPAVMNAAQLEAIVDLERRIVALEVIVAAIALKHPDIAAKVEDGSIFD